MNLRRLVPLLLLAAACRYELTRSLGPGDVRGTAERQVTGGAREGLPGARARLIGTPFAAFSGADGRFVLRNVPSGKHRMVLALDSDSNGTEDLQLRFPEFELLPIGGQNPRGARDFGRVLMEPAGSITGRVVVDGQGIGSAAVYVKEAPGVTANTAADGSFTFPFIAKGTWSLGVVLPGTGAADLGEAVTLAAGERRALGDRTPGTAVPTTLVRGSIAFDDLLSGDDPTGLSLKLVGSAGRFVVPMKADGTYEVEVPVGFYALHLMPDGGVFDSWLPGVVAAPGVEALPLYVLDGTKDVDVDGDGLLGAADPDQDGDGTPDKEEAPSCILLVDATTDLDGDNLCDSVDADRDGDAYDDAFDDCPKVSDPGQEDSDQDGVGDACDNCPTKPNPDQADKDRDGQGDACAGEPTDPCALQNGGCDPDANCTSEGTQVTCACPASQYGPGTWCEPRGVRLLGAAPVPRKSAAFFAVPSLSKLFVVGGSRSSDVWHLDPAAGDWALATDHAFSARPDAVQVAEVQGRVFVLAAYQALTGAVTADVFEYLPETSSTVALPGLVLSGPVAQHLLDGSSRMLAAAPPFLAVLDMQANSLLKADVTAAAPSWTQMSIATATASPTARSGAAVMVNAAGGFVVHGGMSNFSPLWDLAILEPTATAGRYQWRTVALTGLDRTSARVEFAFAGDPATGRLYVHGGGLTSGGTPDSAAYVVDTTTGVVQALSQGTGATPASNHAALIAAEELVVYDGSVRKLPLSGGDWTELAPAPKVPERRDAFAFVVDPDDRSGADVLHLVAGSRFESPIDEHVRFDVANGTWSSVTSDPPATAAERPAACVDPVNHALWTFGGRAQSGYIQTLATLADGGSGWVTTLASNAPEARTGGYMAFDRTGNTLVVFGGSGATGPVTETPWTLDLAGDTPAWTTGTAESRTWDYGAVTFDPDARLLWWFPSQLPTQTGGTIASSYSLESGQWTDVLDSVSVPGDLAGFQAVWDRRNHRAILFGGYFPSQEAENTSIYAFEPVGKTFSRLCPTGFLPVESGSTRAAAYTDDTLYFFDSQLFEVRAIELDMPACGT